MFRNQAGRWRSRIGKAVVYPLSSAIAGLAAGALLGAVGDLFPAGLRWAIASVLGAVAIVAGSIELFGRRIQPTQHDCQTPRRWLLHKKPLVWAIQNGLTLGFGATSRLGFLLWYAVPLGALLSGSPILGGALYGTYGLVRGVAAPLILLYMLRHKEDDFDEWLILHNPSARLLATGQLVLLGVTVTVVGGF